MSSSTTDNRRDPEIDSLLSQTGEPRLMDINRQMFQTLHSLDVELRREQRLAACEKPQPSVPTLQAQSSDATGASGGAGGPSGGAGSASGSSTGAGSGGGTGSSSGSVALSGGTGAGGSGTMVVAAGAGGAGTPAGAATGSAASPASASGGTASGASPSGFIHKSALVHTSSLPSAIGGGGNGFTAPKITPGSDDTIVAKRLRKAAEQEKDPALRAKLWKEYAAYSQGTSPK
jgi:hypothetical protein